MIKRLLSVRRHAFIKLEESKSPDDHAEFYSLVFHDRWLGILAFSYIGSFYLLGVAIFEGSLSAFGGFLLAIAGCLILSVPFFRWYIKRYEKYSDT